MNLKFYTIDENYNNYLRAFDNRVQDISTKNKKENRPFVGILLMVNNVYYCAPLASPKEKHTKMKNQRDFLKINSGLYGAINFNNMIPVTYELITEINLKINNSDNIEMQKYKNLLINQLSWCNSNKYKIIRTADKLYNDVNNQKLPLNIIERCCNFKLLEEKLLNYKK